MKAQATKISSRTAIKNIQKERRIMSMDKPFAFRLAALNAANIGGRVTHDSRPNGVQCPWDGVEYRR